MERKASGEALLEAVALKGRQVVDVGSGDGNFARFMARNGAHVTGIECGAVQLERAHAADKAADERYLEGVGQALPLPDASADVITFMNSLHHVPVEEQGKALQEAARVLKDGGDLYIAEPLAEGPAFELMKPVHDETEVRAVAYSEIQRAGDYGFDAISEETYIEPRRVPKFEALRDAMIAIDPERRQRVMAMEAEFKRSFEEHATHLPDGAWEMIQPMRVNHLRRRPRS
jgi:ubiquinone/menaquinone biosynthesis C-methylase UbiE